MISVKKYLGFKIPATLLAAVLLTACAAQPGRTLNPLAEQAYQQRHDYLSTLDGWILTGRLAANNGKDGGSGSLNWQQRSNLTSMSFRGAMGKGAWDLQASPGLAQLRFADGREFSASGIAELLAVHMQASVPVDALSWWVLGLAQPGDWQERQLDEEGRITHMRQSGWEVYFSGYEFRDQVWLPGKLVARKQDQTVKLAISDWALSPGAEQID